MGALPSAVRARLHAQLRRTRPHDVACYRPDSDEPTIISPKGDRGRWERVLQALPRDLERIEFRDAKAAVLWALDFDREEQQQATTEDRDARRDERLLELLVKAQQAAMAGQLEGFRATMKGLTDTLGIVSGRLGAMEKTFGEVLKLAYEATQAAALAEAQAEAADDGDDPIKALAAAVAGKALPKRASEPKASERSGAGAEPQ